jgi:hypothetical protein
VSDDVPAIPSPSAGPPSQLITREQVTIPRAILLGFLNDCVEKLMVHENIERIVARHLETQEPLYQLMMNYQREVYDLHHSPPFP